MLFPLSLRKVIFMDSDQIIRADVAELWHMDLEVTPVFQMLDQCSPMQGARPGMQKASLSSFAFRQHLCMREPGRDEHMTGFWHATSPAGMHTSLQHQQCIRQRVQTY